MPYPPKKTESFTAIKIALWVIGAGIGYAVFGNLKTLTAQWVAGLCVVSASTIAVYMYVCHLEGILKPADTAIGWGVLATLILAAGYYGLQALAK